MVEVSIAGLKTVPALKAWKEKNFHPDINKAVRLMPTAEIEGFFVAKIRKAF